MENSPVSARDTNADTDADADMVCDGADVDCYSSCWGCGLAMICDYAVEACLSDDGCSAFYQCRSESCCGGTNDCLTGDALAACMTECEDVLGITEYSKDLYMDIEACIVCDACPLSCGVNEFQDVTMCSGLPSINCPTCPCYADEAAEGEIACFSWAGWGGPCTDAQNACHENPDCAALETCINESWQSDDWQNIQAICFADYADVEELYWAYVQCIYCDACNLTCITDASTKKCDEYVQK